MDVEQTIDRMVSVGIVVAAVASTIAGATIVLLLTDPVGVTGAVDSGNVSALVYRLAEVLFGALAAILDYL